jgi:sulfotransferase
MYKIFFQSSLPRSGSTILQNILAQNSDIFPTQASGLLEILLSMREKYTTLQEFKAQHSEITEKAFYKFCQEGLKTYYNTLTDKKYVIDKSRGWGINYDFVHKIIGEEPKIICMIRDIRDILANMESNFRLNPNKQINLYDWSKNQGTTIPKRVDIWLQNTQVGVSIERLSEIFRTGLNTKILFVKYEDLCLYPDTQLSRIYDFLGVPYFEHNFDDIEQNIIQDEVIFDIFPPQKINRKLQPIRSVAKEILSREVCDWIYTNHKWFFENFRYTK